MTDRDRVKLHIGKALSHLMAAFVVEKDNEKAEALMQEIDKLRKIAER